MCPTYFAQSAVLISLYGIHCLFFVLETKLVLHEVGTVTYVPLYPCSFGFLPCYICTTVSLFFLFPPLLDMYHCIPVLFVSSPVTYVPLYPCSFCFLPCYTCTTISLFFFSPPLLRMYHCSPFLYIIIFLINRAAVAVCPKF
jgi:hypothetical protein